MLSDSTAFLYDDEAPWAVRVMEVKKCVERVDMKVDEVKTQVEEVMTQVREAKTQVDEVKIEMRFLESQIDNVRTGVNNSMAIQLNSLRKWLDDPIQPVSASVLIEDRQRFTVAADFPTTVREFWRLLSNKPTLVRLGKHSSVVGWERWQRNSSYDTDATSYDTIENAIA